MLQRVKSLTYKQYAPTNLARIENNFAEYIENLSDGIYNDFFNNILNLFVADYDTLKKYWCLKFNINWKTKFNDVEYQLTEDELRLVIFTINFKNHSRITIDKINEFVSEIYPYFGFRAYCIDIQGMRLDYHFQDFFNAYFIDYMVKYNILPRPLGVDVRLFEADRKFFGLVDNFEDYENTTKTWLTGFINNGQSGEGTKICDNNEG